MRFISIIIYLLFVYIYNPLNNTYQYILDPCLQNHKKVLNYTHIKIIMPLTFVHKINIRVISQTIKASLLNQLQKHV